MSREGHRVDQHDLAHRPAAGALDAGEQLGLAGKSAAAVVAHAGEEIADQSCRPAPRAGPRSRRPAPSHSWRAETIAVKLPNTRSTAESPPRTSTYERPRHALKLDAPSPHPQAAASSGGDRGDKPCNPLRLFRGSRC